MAQLGLIQRAKPYPLMVDRRYDSPGERMINDIRSGDIDAGVLWGPIAGYFAAKGGDKLLVVPLLKETGTPRMAYRITFGVRNLEDDWKRQLNAVIAKRQRRYRCPVAAIRRAAARRAIQSHHPAETMSARIAGGCTVAD